MHKNKDQSNKVYFGMKKFWKPLGRDITIFTQREYFIQVAMTFAMFVLVFYFSNFVFNRIRSQSIAANRFSNVFIFFTISFFFKFKC